MQHTPTGRPGDGILRCVVSDPSRGNSLSITALEQAAEMLGTTPSDANGIRAVILTGSEAAFCNGGDVTAFASAPDPSDYVGDLAKRFHQFIRVVTTTPIPVVAAVQGWAAGAGMSIACAADVIVGSPSTTFLPAYPGIDLSPDGGMTWTLPRLVGFARARDMLLTNQPIRGRAAFDSGLLTRFVDDDQVLSTAESIAVELASGPGSAHGAIKRLLWQAQRVELSPQLDAEAESIAYLAGSADGREGVAAFVERRRPNF
ncbi:MAG: enoyl-CoA hydratase-related protein [Rhodococcus sp. (in: high G+C Gram-positive bacteria)]|uniref:enoyl-CoA hydratase/isomerase family protein n=1 Tax=Rhodococcus sp. TaxID=1831 RepID=UPI003BB0FFE3